MARSEHRPVLGVRSVVTPFPRLARLLLEDLAPLVVAVLGSSEGLVPGGGRRVPGSGGDRWHCGLS